MVKVLKTMPAVQPNAGVRQAYQRDLEALLTEAHLELAMQLSFLWWPSPGAPQLATDAVTVGSVDRVLQAWGRKWVRQFDTLSVTIAKKFANRSFQATEASMQAALKRAGFTVPFRMTRAVADAYKATLAENVALIKSLPQQYITGVQSAVWQSVKQGADMATLSRHLERNYGIARERAALISRDQNAKAKATIEQTRRTQLGIKQAIWQHSSAGKEPRPTHVAMNNKVFDISKGMYDSDEKAYVWPGSLINCRCTSRAIIPGFDEDT